MTILDALTDPRLRLTARERAALEMAAGGFVSGTLAEWPILARAFRALGAPADPNTAATELRRLAQEALATLRGEP